VSTAIDNNGDGRRLNWLPLVAAAIALVGLGDSIYLTWHHYTAEAVPCSLTGGCEMVLTSPYATIADIPIALFGAVAYLDAFILALLTAFGQYRLWFVYGIQTVLMAGFSGWLIFVQANYIHAFCQFCLLSAATSITLFVIFVISFFAGRPRA
jgi:uncharacterized membrane protein